VSRLHKRDCGTMLLLGERLPAFPVNRNDGYPNSGPNPVSRSVQGSRTRSSSHRRRDFRNDIASGRARARHWSRNAHGATRNRSYPGIEVVQQRGVPFSMELSLDALAAHAAIDPSAIAAPLDFLPVVSARQLLASQRIVAPRSNFVDLLALRPIRHDVDVAGEVSAESEAPC